MVQSGSNHAVFKVFQMTCPRRGDWGKKYQYLILTSINHQFTLILGDNSDCHKQTAGRSGAAADLDAAFHLKKCKDFDWFCLKKKKGVLFQFYTILAANMHS